MKKKNLATAMAAAMTLGAVAPVVANADTITSFSLAANPSVDARLASGEKVVSVEGNTVLTRTQAYNTNFTDTTKDDTLKFANARVLKTFDNNGSTDVNTHEYIVVEKASTTEINQAKAESDAMNAKIASYKAETNAAGKAIYKIVEKDASKIERTTTTIDGNDKKTFTDTAKGIEVQYTADHPDVVAKVEVDGKALVAGDKKETFTFTGVVVAEEVNQAPELRKLFAKGDTYTIDLDKKTDTIDDYYQYNEFNYVAKMNEAKFDIVKVETGANELTVKVYVKGAAKIPANLVTTATISTIKDLNTDLVVNMPSKIDVDGTWSADIVKEGMLKGYVVATSEFAPKRNISRAEFAKIVCKAFDIKTDDTAIKDMSEPFHDVAEGEWFYQYVTALYNEKGTGTVGSIIGGYGNKETFAPTVEITKEEAAKMIAAAYDIKKAPLGITDTEITAQEVQDGIVDITVKAGTATAARDIKTQFADDKEIAAWADESAESLRELGILNGTPEKKLMPKSKITREEALTMLVKAGKTEASNKSIK